MYKLIAHRGYKKSSKENSLAAFFDALNNDFVGFECDIRMTKDGQFAVLHDALYKGKLVKNIMQKDLQKDNVPILEDVLKIKTDKIIMIDIKDPFIDIKKLIDILKKYSEQRIYIMSFYDNVIRKLFLKERTYKVGILNYILNTEDKHFEYDFLCILELISNDKIISDYKIKGKELFIYGVKENSLKDLYPYYIVD